MSSFVPTRLVVGFWWLFCIAVVGSYNGNLIAALLTPKLVIPINSLEDIVRNDYTLGWIDQSSEHGIFENSQQGTIYHSLWEKVKRNQRSYLFRNDMHGLEKALTKTNYVALIGKLFYQHLDSENGSLKCELVRAEQEIFPSYFALPFQKQSPYMSAVSVK